MNYSLAHNYSVTGYLKSNDQTPLFYRYYEVENQRATVILIHGFGEHSGRYAHIVDRLRKERLSVFCIDFRGHGHSKGKRGDVERFQLYEEDVKAAIKFIQNKQPPSTKLFILAHSMGALVCLRLISKMSNTIDGLVLSCPLFSLKMPIPAWKKCATTMLAKFLPNFKINSSIKGEQLTTDQAMAKNYDIDPLVLRKVSVRAVTQIIAGYQHMDTLAPVIKHPFFMQVAGRDPVVDSEAARAWFAQINNKDASLKYYPNALHEIYNERDRDEAIDDFIAWFNSRL
jgi:alpha-beta hydrolase superfamily lysophospholipase